MGVDRLRVAQHSAGESTGESTEEGRGMSGGGRRRALRPAVVGGLAAAMAATAGVGSLVAVAPASSAATRAVHAPALLEVLAVPGYGRVLGNAKHLSLYVLSSEQGTKQVCTGKCLKLWPPVLVGAKVKAVSLGAGVTGHVGLVARSATTKQVTFNGYPLFGFAGDTGPHQSRGEGIKAFGGTWTLVRPGAKTAAATGVQPAKAAAKAPGTTTSAGSGY